MYASYSPPIPLLSLRGMYNFYQLLKLLSGFNQTFSVTEFSCLPISNDGLSDLGSWITSEKWLTLIENNDVDDKVTGF